MNPTTTVLPVADHGTPTTTVQDASTPYTSPPQLGLDDVPVRDRSGDAQADRDLTAGDNMPGMPPSVRQAGQERESATLTEQRQENTMVDKATATVQSLPGMPTAPQGNSLSALRTIPEVPEDTAPDEATQDDSTGTVEDPAGDTVNEETPQEGEGARRRGSARTRSRRSSGPKRYTVDLDPELWIWLKHLSLTENLNASEFIRAFLRKAMGDDELVDAILTDVDAGTGALLSAKGNSSTD